MRQRNVIASLVLCTLAGLATNVNAAEPERIEVRGRVHAVVENSVLIAVPLDPKTLEQMGDVSSIRVARIEDVVPNKIFEDHLYVSYKVGTAELVARLERLLGKDVRIELQRNEAFWPSVVYVAIDYQR